VLPAACHSANSPKQKQIKLTCLRLKLSPS
jgi:hypothetical protein